MSVKIDLSDEAHQLLQVLKARYKCRSYSETIITIAKKLLGKEVVRGVLGKDERVI